MSEIAFALRVLGGKEQLDRETLDELAGARRAEYENALRDAGIGRHVVWHQETPDGTMAVVYMEVDDESALGAFGASDAPLNAWFRERMLEVHGIDIGRPAPPPRKVHEVAV